MAIARVRGSWRRRTQQSLRRRCYAFVDSTIFGHSTLSVLVLAIAVLQTGGGGAPDDSCNGAATAALGEDDAIPPLVAVGIQSKRSTEESPSLTILHWNLLASVYTHYLSGAHGHKIALPDGPANRFFEADSQTRARYQMSTRTILERAPDVVTVQECEAKYLDPAWNSLAPKLLEEYVVRIEAAEGLGGAGVFVRRSGLATLVNNTFVSVPGTRLTGGRSKTAVAALLQLANQQVVWVVSAHLAFDNEARVRLLQQLLPLLTGGHEVVFAADFNAEPSTLPEVEAATLLASLSRVKYSKGTVTAAGMYPSLVSACIDHIYAPASFHLQRVEVEPGEARVPYEPTDGELAPVTKGSDHHWVAASFSLPAVVT